MSSLSENSAALGRRRPEKRGFYQLCKGRKRPTGWLCSLCALRAVPPARSPHVHELSEDTVRRFAASFLAHQLSLVCVCHVGPQTVLPAWPGQATARDSRVRCCCCVNVPRRHCARGRCAERWRFGNAPAWAGPRAVWAGRGEQVGLHSTFWALRRRSLGRVWSLPFPSGVWRRPWLTCLLGVGSHRCSLPGWLSSFVSEGQDGAQSPGFPTPDTTTHPSGTGKRPVLCCRSSRRSRHWWGAAPATTGRRLVGGARGPRRAAGRLSHEGGWARGPRASLARPTPLSSPAEPGALHHGHRGPQRGQVLAHQRAQEAAPPQRYSALRWSATRAWVTSSVPFPRAPGAVLRGAWGPSPRPAVRLLAGGSVRSALCRPPF